MYWATFLLTLSALAAAEDGTFPVVASNALLQVPGLAERELQQLHRLRELGSPSEFLWELLTILSSTEPGALDARPIKVAQLLESGGISALALDRLAALKRANDLGAPHVGKIQFSHVSSKNELADIADGSLWLAIRGDGNPQDYCSVAQDLQVIYSKLRPGGFAILHGGADADTELLCNNGTVIAGGVRAAAEDFARGSIGVSGLDLAEELHAQAQGLPPSLGRVVFPGAEVPYWLLRKFPSGMQKDSVPVLPYSSPSAVLQASQGMDPKDAQLMPLARRHSPVDTDEYWSWIAEQMPSTSMSRGEMRSRVGHIMHNMRRHPPIQKIPRLLHQVYGFKCTDWKTGRWEPSCVDQATYDELQRIEELQQCFGGGLPWASSEKQLAESEMEWSLGVAQQVAKSCCDSAATNDTVAVDVWSTVRAETLSISVECSKVPAGCCAQAKQLLPNNRQQGRSAGMREDFLRWAASWKRLHPDWKYIMWGPMEVKRLIRERYEWLAPVMDAYPSWIYRSDVAQWVILHHFGGLYVSLDVEALVPIDSLLAGHAPPAKRCKETFMVQGSEGWELTGGVNLLLNEDGLVREQDELPINRLDLHVIGAIPGHPVMKSMLESLPKNQHEFVLKATGNELLTSLYYEIGHFCAEGSRIASREVYNPIDWGNTEMRHKCFSESCGELFENSMGIHHHARSWFGIRSEQLWDPTKTNGISSDEEQSGK